MQRIKAEAKTASGIYLPESTVKELNEGKVLAVGPGALDKDGRRLPMGVNQGDRVLIPQVRLVWTEALMRSSHPARAINIREPANDNDSTAALLSRLARRNSICSAIASTCLDPCGSSFSKLLSITDTLC